MKNLGKIGLAAGVAAALVLLFRRRKDGTRVFDDVTAQVTKWADALRQFRQDDRPDTNVRTSYHQGTASRPTASTRQPGDMTE
ncbi:MAG: hypothetical protein RI924_465 [Bacteroidota bacterium]|jgi:hypothetical protein